MYRAEFKDSKGNAIGVLHSDNDMLLLHAEQLIIGTTLADERMDGNSVVISSADVYDDDNVFVMTYEPASSKEN